MIKSVFGHSMRAWRGAWRHPGFTLTLVAILGSGVALATVVFAVVDALVLDPYPFGDPDRLLMVGQAMPEIAMPEGYFERFSGPEIADLTAATTTLEAPLAFDLNSVRARLDQVPVRLFAAYFWADPFPTLRVEPTLGRGFRPEELAGSSTGMDAPTGDGIDGEIDGEVDGETGGRPAVALVSHTLWRTELGSDPNVLGRILMVDGLPHTVIGVIPPGANLFGTDLWLAMPEGLATLPRPRRQFNLLARRPAGVEPATLASELGLVARRIEVAHGAEYAEYRDWRLTAVPWNQFISFDYRHEALLSLGAVLFVLLLVCANLANLLLARATDRRGEVALHRALGASESRLLGQGLVEIALYGLFGTAAALLLARWGLDLTMAWLPTDFQGARAPSLAGRPLVFCLAAGALATLACGFAPAWHRLRSPTSLIGRVGRRGTHDRATRRLQRAFVVIQVALALVLSTGGLLLARDFLALTRTELGFDTRNLVSMRLTLPPGEYEPAAVAPFFDTLRQRVSELPGVQSASLATQVPPSTRFGGQLLFGQDPGATNGPAAANSADTERVEVETRGPTVLHTAVGDDFFTTLGHPLWRGRGLDRGERTDGPPALVINRLLAERFFPGQDALGRRLRVVGGSWDTGWGEIVGIAETVRNQGPGEPPSPEVFSHHRQAGGRWNQLFLTVRTEGNPHALVPAIRQLVLALDPDQPVYAIATAADVLASQNAPRRLAATVLGGFAIAALLLAALGIYAVVAFSVARRGREMGLRLALGARRGEILRLVLGESLRQVLLGVALGSVATWALTRGLASSLGPALVFDPAPLALAALLLGTTALLAALAPAHRASRTEPVVALEEE